jgi:hypothetical protein
MKRLFLLLSLTSITLASVPAEQKNVAAKPTQAVELKRKSSFEADNSHDPFWPIGWKKPGPKTDSSEPGPAISPDAFNLSSVTMGAGGHFAILNGRIMQEGQQFGLQYGNQIYQVTLRKVEDGRVVLTYQDSEIIVSLKRR